MQIQTNFHAINLASGFALKTRPNLIRKWPIEFFQSTFVGKLSRIHAVSTDGIKRYLLLICLCQKGVQNSCRITMCVACAYFLPYDSHIFAHKVLIFELRLTHLQGNSRLPLAIRMQRVSHCKEKVVDTA